MRMPKIKSLQTKILLPAILTTVVLLLGLGVFMGLRAKATMSAVLTSNAESTAAFLEEVGIPYILNYDFPALDRIVSQAVKDPEVEFVVYYDDKGKVLTQNSKEKPTAGDTLLLERELKDPDSKNLVGRMKFAFSLGGVARQFHQDVMAIAAAIGGGGFLVLISLLYVVRRGTKPLDAAIGAIAESSNRVAAASVQVSSASRQLADGNSAQAASIEETSSSLEEMSSITKSNAENTERVVALIQVASRVASQANTTMVKLTRSMEEISTASQETSKIIKTIDEIAFQTNLLALNAAVEAARAGEAGAGFAVVADEVRNLAMRAAEAARNTAGLIEGTVNKVKDGSAIVANTNSAFLQVADSVQQATTVIDEIAAASREQAQGIEQISNAVGTMDTMVQQAAANAEESASLSVEMSTQADALRSVVEQLAALVGGNQEKSTEAFAPAEQQRFPVRTASTRAPAPVRRMAKKGNGVALGPPARVDQRPHLEQGDSKEF